MRKAPVAGEFVDYAYALVSRSSSLMIAEDIWCRCVHSIRSERLRMEEIDYNLLFRWFVGLNADDERTMKCGTRPPSARTVTACCRRTWLRSFWQGWSSRRGLRALTSEESPDRNQGNLRISDVNGSCGNQSTPGSTRCEFGCHEAAA